MADELVMAWPRVHVLNKKQRYSLLCAPQCVNNKLTSKVAMKSFLERKHASLYTSPMKYWPANGGASHVYPTLKFKGGLVMIFVNSL